MLDKTEPDELSQAVSASTADELTELMVSTVDEGTASPAAIPGVDVAGKTGTAQSGRDDVPPYAWFISFAPADDPQVAVAVMIQKAGIRAARSRAAQLGGPIAKSVMEAVISDATSTTSFVDDAHRYRLDSRIATGGMGEVGGRPTPCSAAPSRSSCSRRSTPTTRRSAPASRPRPATPRRCTTPGWPRSTTSARPTRSDGSGVARPYLVMELVDGPAALGAAASPAQPLDPDVTRDLLAQAADALGAAHAAGSCTAT